MPNFRVLAQCGGFGDYCGIIASCRGNFKKSLLSLRLHPQMDLHAKFQVPRFSGIGWALLITSVSALATLF